MTIELSCGEDLRDLLLPIDLSKLLNLSARTLSRWHRKRIGPPRIKIGRKVFYRRSAVIAWLGQSEVAFAGNLQRVARK